MPTEGAKEVAKIAVESSGPLLTRIVGAVSAVSAFIAAVWKYTTNRMTKVEQDAAAALVIKRDLDAHIADENGKLEALFRKHDDLHETVTTIRESVARIEGKLNK